MALYSGALSIFETVGCEMHDVETDEQGVRTDSLRQLLEQWPAGKPKPKAFYTVPVRLVLDAHALQQVLMVTVVWLQSHGHDTLS